MQFTVKAKSFLLIVVYTILPFQALHANNQNPSELMDAYFSTLSQLNHVAPGESAAAHGLFGWRIGLGLSQMTSENKQTNELLAQESVDDSSIKNNNISTPKVFLTKGLIYPFDIGLTFSKNTNNNLQHVGSYLQWTLFEAFALPAIAFRAGYSKLFGLNSTKFSSTSSSIIASWGYWKVTGFLSYNLTKHFASYASGFEKHDQVFAQNALNYGLQMNLFSPFSHITFENISLKSSQKTYQAKISFGF